MARVGKAPTERNLNDVFEVKFNFVGSQSVEKSIERLLELGFEVFQNVHNFFYNLLVDYTVRSINKQMEIVVEFEFRWKFHRSLTAAPFG